jgi:hypothetical protein
MATLGPNDLKQWALPAGWDAARLMQVSLQSGETYEQLIGDITQGLAMANAALLSDPLVAGLISTTTEPAIEYACGVSNGFEDHTEYGTPDAKRGSTTGHMLPLNAYDRKLGWTWDFLRKARRAQIDNDVASGMLDLSDAWQKKVLTRLFKSTYDTVGSAGKSMPFADGGTADATWVPPSRPNRAGTFAYTHNHFLRLDGITQANLESAVALLWEHGHDGPYDLLMAQADIAAWTAVATVTGWVKRPDAAIRYGTLTDLANVAGDYLGVVETSFGACRMRATGRVPTKYWSVYKSAGNLDQRNPLRVYESPSYGLGCILLAGDHIRQFPLEQAILFFEFGVGVGEDRTAAVCVYNHDDNLYVIPTIS